MDLLKMCEHKRHNIFEIYDGVIFARKFWKGVAFSLD